MGRPKTGRKPTFVNAKGYRLNWRPDHPKAMYHGYVYEHRLVMEKTLGRVLYDNENVHHKDENRLNNDPSNLEVLSEKDHQRLHHGWKKINDVWWRTCSGCSRFLKVDGNFFRYHNYLVGIKSHGKPWVEYANLCKPCYSERSKKYKKKGR